MIFQKQSINKQEVHILPVSELPDKLTTYQLKYFVQKRENDYLINEIPFIYNGRLNNILNNLAYDAEDLSENDLQKFYPLIKSFILSEDKTYKLIYFPKKTLQKKLLSETKATK